MEQARVETNEAVVVPMNHAELRERVRNLIANEEISQAQLGREANLSSATVSQFMSGSYKGDNNKIAASLIKWLQGRDETAKMHAVLPQTVNWVDTPTSKRIFDVLTYAHHAGDIGVIYGGAGCCKTTTIDHYCQKSVNVWKVTATPATAGVALLLEELAMALGFKDYPLHPARLQRAIVSHVRDRNGMFVVDEAQHLLKGALETARSIHDLTGVGLVLSGNAAVYNNIYKGGSNGFAQIFSRIGKRLALVRPTIGDIHAIAGAFKVTGTGQLRELEKIALQPGALRSMVKVLRLATLLSGGKAIAVEHIAAAREDLQASMMEVAS